MRRWRPFLALRRHLPADTALPTAIRPGTMADAIGPRTAASAASFKKEWASLERSERATHARADNITLGLGSPRGSS